MAVIGFTGKEIADHHCGTISEFESISKILKCLSIISGHKEMTGFRGQHSVFLVFHENHNGGTVGTRPMHFSYKMRVIEVEL